MAGRAKILAILTTTMVVIAPLLPLRSNAIIGLGVAGPVFETNPILIAAATNTAAQSTALTLQGVAKQVFLITTEALKRRLLTLIVDQIIGWIEGEGKPLFVTDWRQFVADAGNIALGDLIQELGLGFLCSPFGLQVQLSVLRPPRFSQYITCTLDDVVQNIEAFYEDFRQGGWLAYAELWQPQNNFYGAVLLAMEEREQRIAAQTEANVLEAIAGSGFLGTRKCDATGRFCFITTPGAQIGALAAKAIGSDIDYLINAQDLAVYVGAIADALINRLIRSGVEGLLSLTRPERQAGGFPDGGLGPCAGLQGSALTSCLAVEQARGGDFQTNQQFYLNQIDATLLPRQAGGQDLKITVNKQVDLVQKLTKLRDCQSAKGLPEVSSTRLNLQTEQLTLNQLQEELIANNEVIDSLLETKAQITSPVVKDTATIAFHFGNIAGLLNGEAALNFQQTKKGQRAEFEKKVNDQLLSVEQQLTACQ